MAFELFRRDLATERERAECGTRSGYNRHLRLRETTCPDCRAAHAARLRARRAKQQ